jgi:hypothetical protein
MPSESQALSELSAGASATAIGARDTRIHTSHQSLLGLNMDAEQTSPHAPRTLNAGHASAGPDDSSEAWTHRQARAADVVMQAYARRLSEEAHPDSAHPPLHQTLPAPPSTIRGSWLRHRFPRRQPVWSFGRLAIGARRREQPV